MTRPDPAIRGAASHAWTEWEDHHVFIGTDGARHADRIISRATLSKED